MTRLVEFEVADAAAYIGLAASTLRLQLASGRMKGRREKRAGRLVWLVRKSELDRYSREQKGKVGNPNFKKAKNDSEKTLMEMKNAKHD